MKLRTLLRGIMYHDTATIYRAVLTQVGRTDDYTTKYELILADIPCRLALYHERPTFHRDDVSQKDTLNYMLYFDPRYDILENDQIDILHEGQIFKMFAGSVFKYPTHCELQLKRRKEARQQ